MIFNEQSIQMNGIGNFIAAQIKVLCAKGS